MNDNNLPEAVIRTGPNGTVTCQPFLKYCICTASNTLLLVNRPHVQRSSLHSHAARFNSTSTRSDPTSSHSGSSRERAGTYTDAASMDRSPTPPMNPIPPTHHHDEIHPDRGQPGVESFLPYTQVLYDELRDGAREGAPPDINAIGAGQRSSFLSAIQSVGSSNAGPRYSQLDANPRAITPDADGNAPIQYALNQITRDEDERHARQYPVVVEEGQGLLAERPMTPGYVAQTIPITEPQITRSYETPHGRHPATALPRTPDMLVAYEHEEPKLNFLPGILRPLWLGIYIFLILLFSTLR